MSEIALGHDMIAVEDGLLFVQSEAGEYNATHAIEVGILLEQGLAHEVPGGVLLRWADWPIALNLGISSLTVHTQPSALLLEIDRVGELGRPAFEYVLRWYDGATLVPVNRVGAYVKMSDGRMLHLDGRTVQLTEAADFFNQLEPEERADPRKAYATLAKVHEAAAGAAVLLDRHLRNTAVLIPSTLGLSIKTHDDGTISFLPRLPGAAESGQFTAKFEGSLTIHPVESLTLADGRRVRVLLSDAQQEVLRRMQAVRRLGGPDAKRLSDAPEALFDGLGDAIDLTNIEREYGPRVIGVGALPKTTDVKAAQGPTIIQRMQPDGEKGEPEATVSAGGPMNPRRAAVAIDVLDSATGKLATIRLKTEEEIAKLHAVVSNAATAGESDCVFAGQRFKVDHALVEVLSRHLTNEGGQEHEEGEIGATGHLYLLINEHEETLTPELLVDAAAGEHATPLAELQLPAALGEQVTLQQHQTDGVRWLATCRSQAQRRGGVLADDMGLGKTLQLLTHIATLIETGAIADSGESRENGPWRPVLIVAPLLLIETETWTREMQEKFGDAGRVFEPWLVLRDEGLRKVRHTEGGKDYLGKPLLDPRRIMAHKVVLTTYETLLAYQHSLAQRIDGRPMWSLVIFDEAQEIKAPKAKVSFAAKALDAAFKIAATGTPVETRLRDLWNLLDTVEPTYLGTQRDFVATIERPAMNAEDAEQRHEALERLRGRLRYRRHDALLLRRDKTILTGMPAKHEHRVRCEMTTLERGVILRILDAMQAGPGKRNSLQSLQQLHLASQHPVLAGAKGDPTDVEWLIDSSSRLQALVDILSDVRARGEKALIFARSVEAQRMLAAVLSSRFGIVVDVINGQTGVGEVARGQRAGQVRKAMLDRFQRTAEFGAIVLSPFVAGVGLTITAANHVIHYGRWWNPAVEGQATDRAYRIGQTRDVHVHYLISVDSTGAITKSFDEALDELIA